MVTRTPAQGAAPQPAQAPPDWHIYCVAQAAQVLELQAAQELQVQQDLHLQAVLLVEARERANPIDCAFHRHIIFNWQRLASKLILIAHFRRQFSVCGLLCKRFKSIGPGHY